MNTENKNSIPETYKLLLIKGIPDIYYISFENHNIWNSETNHYIIPNEKYGGLVNLRTTEIENQRYRSFRFQNLIETKIPEGFVLCQGKGSHNDRKHYINRSGEIFINSKRKQGIIHPYLDNNGYNVINFSDENGQLYSRNSCFNCGSIHSESIKFTIS